MNNTPIWASYGAGAGLIRWCRVVVLDCSGRGKKERETTRDGMVLTDF